MKFDIKNNISNKITSRTISYNKIKIQHHLQEQPHTNIKTITSNMSNFKINLNDEAINEECNPCTNK